MGFQLPGQQQSKVDFSKLFENLGGLRQGQSGLQPQTAQQGNTFQTPSFNPAAGSPADQSKAQGMDTLLQILQSQGATDPMLMNQILSGISRDTAQQQRFTAGQFAQGGAQNSGVGQAIAAAQGMAGVDQTAQVRAQEAQRQEQRMREDLGLLMDLVYGPELAREEMANQRAIAHIQKPDEPSDLEKFLGIGGDLLGAASQVSQAGGFKDMFKDLF